MEVVTFKIDENLLVLLDFYAINHRLSRSEVIRKAIEKLVQDEINKEIVHKAKVEKFKL
ncbi:putative transcriptional regulator [Metallosphaera rod-shaped virus 1]|uniref:Putative transcriptional regulator n=1 Tax=Metallosphaera rod-shaped virus 1 TaxID=2730618 RepID=A0A6M3VXK4_9VIRU|nr:putative transcriptional regulator [Metallosphaera rod-shaped virus 1]QJF12347.1 putative transcriptional regulator [Metallosphaera rod-shaped virus 1]